MANSLLKLTVESSEYDAKLKKAADGIRHLADVAHKSGGDLTGLEKAELDYIKALGDMETKSRSAAGQVRELESTYKELKVVYDQLNDVEKADEGGKALAASLETLKQRAQDARRGLDDASKSLQENADAGKEDSSVLAQLASKFTVNIDALKLFDIGLQAAKAALDVAKDAFFASETNVDEWGRTLRSADGIYQSFLQSLNTGDFSGFLNNIGQVTQAAREAYNALDELGTRMTIINPERAKLQARQQELRAEIRRNGADSEVGKAALAELKKIEPLLSKSYKTESQMNYAAFEKLVRERLAEGGINLNQKSFNDFMKTFSNDAAFQSLRKNARGSLTTEMTGNAYNPNAVMTRRTVDTRNTEQKLLDLFTDEWRKANSGYLAASFSAQGAAASNMLGNSRYMKTASGGGSGGGRGTNAPTYQPGSLAEALADVQKYTKLWQDAGDAVRDSFLPQVIAAEERARKMKEDMAWAKDLAMGKYSGQGDFTKGLSDARSVRFNTTLDDMVRDGKDVAKSGTMLLSDKAMAVVTKQIKEATKPQKKEEKSAVEVFGQMNQGINQIVGGIEGLGITIPEELSGILGGINSMLSVLQGITILVQGIAAMKEIGTFLGIIPGMARSGIVPHAANGYYVPGNHYSNDVTPVMANAGELILNKAAQGNIASQLNGGWDNLNLTATIRGEQIRLAVNNNGKRTGRGEMVQTNRR